jgi:hypothetical protein
VPIRFRRSFKIAPGIRASIGKRSGSMSVGVPGARYTASTSGRRTKSVGIPGTGIGYVKTSSGAKEDTSDAASTPMLRGRFWIVVIIAALIAVGYLGWFVGLALVGLALVLIVVFERRRLATPPADSDGGEEAPNR